MGAIKKNNENKVKRHVYQHLLYVGKVKYTICAKNTVLTEDISQTRSDWLWLKVCSLSREKLFTVQFRYNSHGLRKCYEIITFL